MADEYNYQELDALIGQFFSINNMTYGDEKQPFIVRYRGFLKSNNSLSAYEAIEQALTAHHLVPVLRRENEEHVLFLVPEKQKSKPLKAKINLILFVLTLVSVLATAVFMATKEPCLIIPGRHSGC